MTKVVFQLVEGVQVGQSQQFDEVVEGLLQDSFQSLCRRQAEAVILVGDSFGQ